MEGNGLRSLFVQFHKLGECLILRIVSFIFLLKFVFCSSLNGLQTEWVFFFCNCAWNFFVIFLWYERFWSMALKYCLLFEVTIITGITMFHFNRQYGIIVANYTKAPVIKLFECSNTFVLGLNKPHSSHEWTEVYFVRPALCLVCEYICTFWLTGTCSVLIAFLLRSGNDYIWGVRVKALKCSSELLWTSPSITKNSNHDVFPTDCQATIHKSCESCVSAFACTAVSNSTSGFDHPIVSVDYKIIAARICKCMS